MYTLFREFVGSRKNQQKISQATLTYFLLLLFSELNLVRNGSREKITHIFVRIHSTFQLSRCSVQ